MTDQILSAQAVQFLLSGTSDLFRDPALQQAPKQLGDIPVLRRLIHEAETDLRSHGPGLVARQATGATLRMALREEGYPCPDPAWLPKKLRYVYRPTGEGGLRRRRCRVEDRQLTFGDSDNA